MGVIGVSFVVSVVVIVIIIRFGGLIMGGKVFIKRNIASYSHYLAMLEDKEEIE